MGINKPILGFTCRDVDNKKESKNALKESQTDLMGSTII